MEGIINLNHHTLFSSKTAKESIEKLKLVDRIVKIFTVDNNTIIVNYKSINGNYIAVEIPSIKEEDFKRFIELLISLITVEGLTDETKLVEFIKILGYNESATIDFYNNIYSNSEFIRDISESNLKDIMIQYTQPSKKKSWFSL